MTPREWLITAAWVLVMGALLWWAGGKIDRDEAQMEKDQDAKGGQKLGAPDHRSDPRGNKAPRAIASEGYRAGPRK